MTTDVSTEVDPTLVRAVAEGSAEALGALYDRHAGTVYGLAKRILIRQEARRRSCRTCSRRSGATRRGTTRAGRRWPAGSWCWRGPAPSIVCERDARARISDARRRSGALDGACRSWRWRPIAAPSRPQSAAEDGAPGESRRSATLPDTAAHVSIELAYCEGLSHSGIAGADGRAARHGEDAPADGHGDPQRGAGGVTSDTHESVRTRARGRLRAGRARSRSSAWRSRRTSSTCDALPGARSSNTGALARWASGWPPTPSSPPAAPEGARPGARDGRRHAAIGPALGTHSSSARRGGDRVRDRTAASGRARAIECRGAWRLAAAAGVLLAVAAGIYAMVAAPPGRGPRGRARSRMPGVSANAPPALRASLARGAPRFGAAHPHTLDDASARRTCSASSLRGLAGRACGDRPARFWSRASAGSSSARASASGARSRAASISLWMVADRSGPIERGRPDARRRRSDRRHGRASPLRRPEP